MQYTAQWGPKGFIVEPNKIVPLNDLVTSYALKKDNAGDTSGTAQTNTRGKEPQTVSLSTVYVRAAGVDPRAQIDEWNAEIGNAYPLYIGGERFGPKKLKLTKVDVSDIKLSTTGVFLSTKVAVTLEEYNEPVVYVSSNKGSGSGSSGSSGGGKGSTQSGKEVQYVMTDLGKPNGPINGVPNWYVSVEGAIGSTITREDKQAAVDNWHLLGAAHPEYAEQILNNFREGKYQKQSQSNAAPSYVGFEQFETVIKIGEIAELPYGERVVATFMELGNKGLDFVFS